MMKAKRILLAFGLMTVAGAASAAYDYSGYIKLQKSDPAGQSSFTNMLDTVYGWDDPVNGKGAAPRSDADYVVNGNGVSLRSPYDASTTTRYVFGGRSLVVDASSTGYGLILQSANTASLQFDDLILRKGGLSNGSWSHSNPIYGKITVEAPASAPVVMQPNGSGHHWYMYATLAGAGALKIYGNTSPDTYATRTWYYDQIGDASQFTGTLTSAYKQNIVMRCAEFGGTVALDFLGVLQTGTATGDATTVHVPHVVSTNGYVQVTKGKTLNVDSLVSGGTETNNVIEIQEGAKLVVGTLSLDGTTLKFGGANGTLYVTDKLTFTRPIVLTPSTAAESLILSVPESAGQILLGDFKVTSPSQFLRLVKENGVTKIYSHNKLFDAKRGYVTLMRTETSAPKNGNYTLAYNTSGIGTDEKGWSDKEAPHSNTNYYSQYVIRTVDETFKGKSLTIGKSSTAQLRVISHFTVNDLRMVSPCEWSTSGSGSSFTCKGKSLTVGTTNNAPLRLTGGVNGQAYVIESALHGMTDAEIACQVSSTTKVGDGRYTAVKLMGDNSDYFGSVWVDYQTTLTLGSSMPGKVILGSDTAEQTSTLTTSAAAGKTIAIRALESDVHGTVNVPSGNTLAVEEGLTVNKTLVKTGVGTLVLGGSATAGSAEAVLRIEAGSVKPLTAAATAVPIVFAGGSVTLDWKPTDAEVVAKGVDLSQADFTLTGDKLNVVFDFADWTPDRDTTYVRNVVTVKDADAAKLAGKIAVSRIKGHVVKFLDPVSSGGLTTFRVAFEPTGLIIFLGSSSAPVRHLFMAGDSTLDEHRGETNAKGYVSWGVRLAPYLKGDVRIVDYARSGFTTTRFMSPDEKRGDVNWWERIKAEAQAGDYVMIQFGHNDQKSLTIAKFKENLATMVGDVKAKGAVPVLVTPIPRLTFREGTLVDDIHISDTVTGKDTLDNYAQAMRDVATETGAELADFRPLLQAKAQEVGETEALTWTVADDLTHPAEKGATLYASIFRDYIRTSGLSFAGLFC